MADVRPERPQPLDEVMLAMDVVDTLRHRQTVAERELARPESDEALVERLRQIYEAQGIEVSDRILREGVEALREDRFAYRPPRHVPLWARMYVERGQWLRRALMLAVVALIAFGAHRALVVAPRQNLAAQLDADRAAVVALANDPAIERRADAIYERATSAVEAGDLSLARREQAELEELRSQLELSYELVIATGPASAIGVWRVPDLNEAARNYYLIVEAIDASGQRVRLPVRSEETGETDRVATFGLGVPESVWEDVATDLEDDGIIQDDLVGVKGRGELEPEYLVETTGGAITRW